MRAPKSQVSSSGKGFNGTNILDSSINSDACSEAPKARDVIARANGPGMIRALTGSAESATCGSAKGPILRERCLRGSAHFALSALNQTTIAAPGPVGPGYYISRLRRSRQQPCRSHDLMSQVC